MDVERVDSDGVSSEESEATIGCFTSTLEEQRRVARFLKAKPSSDQLQMIAAFNSKLHDGGDGLLIGDSDWDFLFYFLITSLLLRVFEHAETCLLILPNEGSLKLVRWIMHSFIQDIDPEMWIMYRSGKGRKALFERLMRSVDMTQEQPTRVGGFLIITTLQDVVKDASLAPFCIKNGHFQPSFRSVCNMPECGLMDGKLDISNIVIVPSTDEDAKEFSSHGIPKTLMRAKNGNIRALTMLLYCAHPHSKQFARCFVAIPTPTITLDIITLLSVLDIHHEIAAALGDDGDYSDAEIFSALVETYGLEALAGVLTDCPSIRALRLNKTMGKIFRKSLPRENFGEEYLGRGEKPLYW